jgi:hypothetical protein
VVVLVPAVVGVVVTLSGLDEGDQRRAETGLVRAFAPFEPLAPVVVVLNRFDAADALHRANRSWLSDRFGLRLVPDAAALAELVRADPTTRPTAS